MMKRWIRFGSRSDDERKRIGEGRRQEGFLKFLVGF